MANSEQWRLGTRWLHGGMALVVTFQLMISLVMEAPRPGKSATVMPLLAFHLHEWVGLFAVLIIGAHWVYTVTVQGGNDLTHMFPWARAGRTHVLLEIRQLLRGQLPDGGPTGGLAGLVHGLGLVAVTGMALSGIVLFFTWSTHGALAYRAAWAHSLIANFAWAYWYGHVGLALLHEARGQRVLKGVFRGNSRTD